ncbi:MAG: hypothetical protein QNJ38_22815 [Prochloraceae cyanobacterium]|nr:hypothetical protein [Prochloraceae cyanobacterium]
MDKWNILLESKDDGLTVATVLEVPDLQTTDKTKQGAIEKIRQLLKQRLAKAEIVQIETPIRSVSQKNNLMKFAGIFANDPDFQDIISQIQAEREDNI